MHSNKSKESIYKLFEIGLKNSEIARAKKITEATVRKYRRDFNDRGNNNKSDRKETGQTKENRNSSPDNLRKTESESNIVNEHSDSSEKTINFIGGKKHMNKKETEDQDEGSECDNCGQDLSGKPKFCPGCGIELNWEE